MVLFAPGSSKGGLDSLQIFLEFDAVVAIPAEQ